LDENSEAAAQVRDFCPIRVVDVEEFDDPSDIVSQIRRVARLASMAARAGAQGLDNSHPCDWLID